MIWSTTLLLLLLTLGYFGCSSSTVVKTDYGAVEGRRETVNGKNVSVFLSIPYADPPTGEYRFAPTRTLSPWQDTLETKALPKSCFQMATEDMKRDLWYVSESTQSEDCLYLNVWKPENTGDNLPVMIWIHPGAFSAGSSNMLLYDGSVLAVEGNVIVVTLNYRLSVFGFLFMNSSEVPGNAGLQDQIQAIKWVAQNVHHFGGDPKRITLFGQSAGSASVGFHLLNDNVNKLFQNAIMQSGPSNTVVQSSKLDVALKSAIKLAQHVGCSSRNDVVLDQRVLDCLRTKTPAELTSPYLLHANFYNLNQFVPVNNGIELPTDPTAITNQFPDVNLISGDIPNELTAFLESYFPGKILTYNMTVNEYELRGLLTKVYGLKNEKIQDAVLSQYVDMHELRHQTEFRMVAAAVLTDSGYICPQIEMTKSWSAGSRKTYYYDFSHRPSKTWKTAVPDWAGSVHGDELPFLFGAPLRPGRMGYTKQEVLLSKKMIQYWTNFARYGDPNGENSSEVIWPRVNGKQQLSYLEIGETQTAKASLKERECFFWKNVYPQLLNFTF